jgi:hypothetical protein
MRFWVVVAAVLLSTSTAFAGGKPAGIVIPPIEAQYGASAPLGEATPIANSTELHIGAHWASLAWKPTRFDIGVGYAGSFRTLAPASSPRAIDSLTIDAEPELRLHGMYFSLAYAIESHRYWRTWIGGRVETLRGDYQDRSLNVVGGSVRIAAEIFTAGADAAGDRNVLAFMAGAWALGVYVEGTARSLPDELGPIGVGAGVSMRVPFILAVAD